jgi:hypothetical protein
VGKLPPNKSEALSPNPVLKKKKGKQKIEQVQSRGWYHWEGEDIRTGHRRVNMVEYYALMNENGKVRPAETVPGIRGDKGE